MARMRRALSAMPSTVFKMAERAAGVSSTMLPLGSIMRSHRSRMHSAAPFTNRTLPAIISSEMHTAADRCESAASYKQSQTDVEHTSVGHT